VSWPIQFRDDAETTLSRSKFRIVGAATRKPQDGGHNWQSWKSVDQVHVGCTRAIGWRYCMRRLNWCWERGSDWKQWAEIMPNDRMSVEYTVG